MWVGIEGLIGAGKTTTAEQIQQDPRFSVAYEPSDRHPFLAPFYADPERYALAVEIGFVLLHSQAAARVQTSGLAATDFAPAKDLIFAGLLLDGDDFAAFRGLYDEAWSDLGVPDRAVFLDVPPEVCLERIRRRGRPYEREIGSAYLQDLRGAYLSVLDELAEDVRVVELSGGETRSEVCAAVVRAAGLAA